MSRILTRQQVLEWCEAWSHSDRKLVAHALDCLPEADYYEITSRGYVGARVGGKVGVYVMPGYLEWPSAAAVERVDASRFPGGIQSSDGPSHWYALSTFRHRGEATTTSEEERELCPTCWTELSVSGVCGCG